MIFIEDRLSKLKAGETIKYRESGNSMLPLIKSRELITCAPISDPATISIGDVVFCKVKGRYYTHLVKATKVLERKKTGKVIMFLIGNNHGGTNGWVQSRNVFGKVISVGGLE